MKMTLQEAVNAIAKGLAAQNWQKSIEITPNSEKCLYRKVNEDGTVLKCAIGQIIPDSMYSELIEGARAFEALEDSGVKIDYDPLFLRGILSFIQQAHDLSCSPENMKCSLRNVINDAGLIMPPELSGE